MAEKAIGKIANYFGRIGVAVVEVTEESLRVGDRIHIKGHTTDLEMEIASLQIEHEQVDEVKVGDSAGLKVNEAVKRNDIVYKVTE